MFNLFNRKKKMSVQELREQYQPVLDDMWVVNFIHEPWKVGGIDVDIRKVGIDKASAHREGIYVTSSECAELHGWVSDAQLCGYLDRIESTSSGWTGFFETEEAAKKAYADTIAKWIAAMQKSVEDVCGKGGHHE